MCTAIAEKTPMEGAARAPGGWFSLNQLYVAYDHPFYIDLEHALCVSFVREAEDTIARVALELPRQAARDLAHRILAVLDRADAYEAR
jgi:hypothetical protein